ncbi:MAG: hypothetical protein JWO78_1723 [Micavibrio sp.]|nr:hypothetical protein [Micavibrio sp.]
MFLFRRKAQAPIIEDEAEAVLVEMPQDRIERALRESCDEDNEFSARLIDAVKIIQKDRVMMAGDTACTYAEALQALLALVKRRGDDDIKILKSALRNVVDHITGEGQQYKSPEEATIALQDLRNRN